MSVASAEPDRAPARRRQWIVIGAVASCAAISFSAAPPAEAEQVGLHTVATTTADQQLNLVDGRVPADHLDIRPLGQDTPTTAAIEQVETVFQRHNDGKVFRWTGAPCSGTSCTGWVMLDNNPGTVEISASSDS
jgi:hypothetical protein